MECRFGQGEMAGGVKGIERVVLQEVRDNLNKDVTDFRRLSSFRQVRHTDRTKENGFLVWKHSHCPFRGIKPWCFVL